MSKYIKKEKTALQRFNEKIIKTKTCWLWTANKDKDGYGKFYLGGGCRAPRAAYKLFKGEIPKGLCVLHSCDVRECVNPDHLWLGTNTDNMRDKIRKGRGNMPSGNQHHSRRHPEKMKRGENHPNSKLNSAAALEIISSNASQKILSAKFKVSEGAITAVRRGITWRHITKKSTSGD